MGMMPKKVAFFFVFLSMASLANSSTEKSERISAASDPLHITSDELFHRITDTSNQIKDLSAQIDLSLKLQNLGLSFNLSGDFYYKQPDKMKLKLHHIPEFLASRQNEAVGTTMILQDIRRNMTKNYQGRILTELPFLGENCYLVELIPKTKQNVNKILLWINAANYTIPQVIMEYDDGSNFMQRKTFVETDHVFVVSKMETTVESPDVQADIQATFKDYQINKGLPDTLFDNSSGQQQALSTF